MFHRYRFGPIAVIVAAMFVCAVALLPVSAAGDGSLARVQSAGKLVVGIGGGFPPFNMFDEHGELDGFDADIARELARRLDVEIEFSQTAFEGLIIALLAGHSDVVVSSLAITPERQERVAFTQTYYRSGAQIVVPTGSDIQGPADLAGRRVAVALGTTYLDELEKLGADIAGYEDDLQTFTELAFGRVDALVTDRLVAIMVIEERGYDMHLVEELIYTENIGIAARLQDEDLVVALNAALDEIYEDGTYADISHKWFGTDIR